MRKAAQISCLPVTRVSKKSDLSRARVVGVHVLAGRDDQGWGGRSGRVAWAESGRRDMRVSLGEAGLGVDRLECELEPLREGGAIARGWLVMAVCESMTLGWDAAGLVYVRVCDAATGLWPPGPSDGVELQQP